jgi:Phasin protein
MSRKTQEKRSEAGENTGLRLRDERTVRPGADGNAPMIGNPGQSGTKIASSPAENSMAQMGSVPGIVGDTARRATEQLSRNTESILQFGTILADATHNVSREWMQFAQKSAEHSLNGLRALAHTGSPEGVLAVYRDLVRYNLEEFGHSAQRIAAISLRAAAEAARIMSGSPQLSPSLHSHLTSRFLSTTAAELLAGDIGPGLGIAENAAKRP